MTAWPYSTAWPARLRNRVANQLFDFALTPFLRKINRWRGCWNLPPIRSLEDTFSPLAQFSQETTDFDFPNASLPPTFHHIGLIERLPAAADFPFHRLNGKPLIYCSFGTLNNGLQWLDVDMTHAREVMNVLRAEGIRVTYGHIIVRAVALALAALPDFHVLVCRLRRHRPARVDIALSVGGDTIAAPVMIIEGADGKSLHDLAAEIANRTPETREANKRGIERLSRWGWLVPFGFLRRAFIRTLLSSITVRRRMLGTFQVSILPDVDFCATSMFGTSAILTAGRVKDRPVIVDGQIVIRPMVTLTCCGDHRVFDGKAASNFLNVVRTSLESMGSISAQR